jgi:hypothetical protein
MEELIEERKKIKEEFNKQLKNFNKKLDSFIKNEKYKNNVEFREAVKRKTRERYHNMTKGTNENLIDV